MSKTICRALTGASGLPYGLRLLECLLAAGCRVQLLYSQAAQVVARQEMDLELPSRPAEAKAALGPLGEKGWVLAALADYMGRRRS